MFGKMKEKNTGKITVVTVCKNTKDTIRDTITSVLHQSYADFEYLIIDGASEDGTVEIVKSYLIDSRIRFISEEDSGLYNAMNKAVRVSHGDYIIFINSGDIFHKENVLEEAVKQLDDCDIGYGNVRKLYANECREERYPGRFKVLTLLLMGKMPCHQGIFAKTSLLKQYRFDETYRITADYDFLIRCYRAKCRLKWLDIIVADVDCVDGISSQKKNLKEMRAEDDGSLKKNMPGWYYAVILPKRLWRQLRDSV